MSKIEYGKIYSRADGKLVYHEHVVLLKQHPKDVIEGINVVNGDAAFFHLGIIEKFYRIQK